MTTIRLSTTPSCAEPEAGAVPQARRSESGSAYLATLLVLVVLTILGLSLAVITQTEVLIGGSEKQAARQLFDAGSGVDLAVTYMLVKRDAAVHDMRLAARTDADIGDVVCTSPFVQIHTTPCNLCALNQDTEYRAVQYGVTTNALRRGGDDFSARKVVGSAIAFEPFQNNLNGYQMTSDVRLKAAAAGPVIDIDPTTKIDPCEGLFLKI